MAALPKAVQEANELVRNKLHELAATGTKMAIPPYSPAEEYNIEKRVLSWYDQTDISNPYVLAAAALAFGEFPNERISYEDILEQKILWFMADNKTLHKSWLEE